jgi:hypothetical protein
MVRVHWLVDANRRNQYESAEMISPPALVIMY